MKNAKPYTKSAWDKIGNEPEYNWIQMNHHCTVITLSSSN